MPVPAQRHERLVGTASAFAGEHVQADVGSGRTARRFRASAGLSSSKPV